MEENHERLRARLADWVNRAKEDTSLDNEGFSEGFKHITAKKVRDKCASSKDAKTMQEQSGPRP